MGWLITVVVSVMNHGRTSHITASTIAAYSSAIAPQEHKNRAKTRRRTTPSGCLFDKILPKGDKNMALDLLTCLEF